MIPDYMAPIVAYREWSVQPSGLLSGLAVAQPWRPKRALEAVCNGQQDTRSGDLSSHFVDGEWRDAPLQACSCGIYALKERPTYTPWYGSGHAQAIGEVWLWGRVIEHMLGYRAQYAYPKALTVHGGTAELAAKVAAAYGISADWKEPAPAMQEGDWITIPAGAWSRKVVYYGSITSSPLVFGNSSALTWTPIDESDEDKQQRLDRESHEKNKALMKPKRKSKSFWRFNG